MIKRSEMNPIITPEDIVPSHEGLWVAGVFNAGVTLFNNEILLLLRISEEAINPSKTLVRVPALDGQGQLGFLEFDKESSADNYDFTDPRSVRYPSAHTKQKVRQLTSLSHFRLARSHDGIQFTIEDKPTIFPEGPMEQWGIEDPRITKINGAYGITYSQVSPYGVGTGLIITEDFKTFIRKGMIFPPENKDVCLFPEKVNGKYLAYHRPVPSAIGSPDIWLAESEDLVHWGKHQHVLSSGQVGESVRIGGGAPPIKTEKGWLTIIHAANEGKTYSLWAFLFDLDDPSKIVAQSREPLMVPEKPYEIQGYFPNVVFTCGAYIQKDTLVVYYGLTDDKMGQAEVDLRALYESMEFKATPADKAQRK